MKTNRFIQWTRSLRELYYHGKSEEILQQYQNQSISSSPSDLPVQTYCLLFKACISTKNWSTGQQLYNQIKTNTTFFNDQRLKIIILNMYSKSGDFIQAENILSDLINLLPITAYPHHIDPTAFSVLMTGYNLHHQPDKTLLTFNRVQNPDRISYLLAFQACAQVKDLQQGKVLVEKLIKSNINLQNDIKLQTVLFDMYGKCGDISSAENMFRTIQQPTIVHYNSLLKVYNDHQMYDKVFKLYDQLKENMKPDPITFSCLFYSIAKIRKLDQCEKIFNDLNSSNIQLNQYPILQVNLINAFSKCKDMITSQKIFDQLPEPRTTAVYNALMKGYNYIEKPLITLSIFEQILQPDAISYLILINSCSQIAMLRRAKLLYQQISKDFPSYEKDLRIMNALIDTFGKCGDVTIAHDIFSKIANKDLISYNALINAYGLNGDGLKALEIYDNLLKNSKLIPNEQTYSIILNACSHSLLVNQAKEIFYSIPIQRRNVFIYATMIDGLCRASQLDEAQNLLIEYEKINRKYPPMYVTLLTGYSRLKNLSKVLEIYHKIHEYFPNESTYLSSSTILLANTYAFLGNLSKAINLRTNLTMKKYPGISWTETVDGKIHEFLAHDTRHEQTKEIYHELKLISEQLKQDGYINDQRWITSDRGFNEDINPLDSHSERLALAYQLYLRKRNLHIEPIQITKNLRICGDCHEIFKRLTRINQELIILMRDRTRQHKFQQGKCSCNDYF